MFAVIDEACCSRTYNELPDVVDADAALKPLGTELKEAVTRASEVCRGNWFPSESLGGFLLHKHWDIGKEQSMVELPGSTPQAVVRCAPPRDLRRCSAQRHLVGSKLISTAGSWSPSSSQLTRSCVTRGAHSRRDLT